MSIRHTKNATTMSVKRHVRCQTVETVTSTPVVMAENNANIVGADVTAGNAIAYSGRDHIAVGTDQYDLNAV